MRRIVTTLLDLAGVASVVAGVYLVLGLGVALIAGGAAALAISWRASA